MMQLKSNRWRYIVLFTYVILLGVAIIKHEPWFDEAQAWLLARDTSIYELLSTYMRYEGSPGLWHLILVIPAKLGFPYASLNILSGCIALTSVILFIRYSPFPTYIKALYPFSFFAFYQYAVIARSYVLLPLLLFLIAAVYENKNDRPFLFIVLLILLANVSMHGLIIAGGIAFIHFIDLVKSWNLSIPSMKLKHLGFLGVFGLIVLLLFFELKPAPDIITFAAFNRDISQFYDRTMSMFSDAITTNVSLQNTGILWYLRFVRHFFRFTVIVSLLWFILRKKLTLFLIPLAGLGVLFTAVYSNLWHQGTMFYLWLFVLWISFYGKHEEVKLQSGVKKAVLFAITTVLAVQTGWSYNSFVYDFKHSYSASKEASNYIRNNHLDHKKIYMTGFHSISILPYFDRNLFCNYNLGQKPCFWLWSSKNNIYREPYLNLSQYQPDYILMGVKQYQDKITFLDNSMLPSIPGYREVKFFDGGLFWKNSYFETDSFALYERIPSESSIFSQNNP